MDFWVWVVILFIAWALEALSSAAKKKRQHPPPEGRSRELRRPPRPAPPPRAEQPLPRPASRPPIGRRPAPPPVLIPERAEREADDVEVRIIRTREGESTEALEGISAEVGRTVVSLESPGPQHLRALEKYGPGVLPRAKRRRGADRRRGRLREAIVWMEILGPPKGR